MVSANPATLRAADSHDAMRPLFDFCCLTAAQVGTEAVAHAIRLKS